MRATSATSWSRIGMMVATKPAVESRCGIAFSPDRHRFDQRCFGRDFECLAEQPERKRNRRTLDDHVAIPPIRLGRHRAGQEPSGLRGRPLRPARTRSRISLSASAFRPISVNSRCVRIWAALPPTECDRRSFDQLRLVFAGRVQISQADGRRGPAGNAGDARSGSYGRP